MKKIDSLEKIQENFSLIIGNFDGVHKGHQALLDEFILKTKKNGYKTCVLSFKPHPKVFFEEIKSDFLLTLEDEKTDKLEKIGIDYYTSFEFNDFLSKLSGDDFFEKFILPSNIKQIYLGHDFSLGANKSFFKRDVISLLEGKDIEVMELSIYLEEEKRVSSTLIREHLHHGDILEASKLLGRNFTLEGSVFHGEKLGRKMNFPTINLSFNLLKILPKTGVYKTKVEINKNKFNALTNIGRRPTFGEHPITVESFLLDFNDEVYGETVSVEFLDFVRDEKKFSGIDELKAQIKKDLEKSWNIK